MVDLLIYQDKWEKLVDKATTNGYDSLGPVEKIWFNIQSLTIAIRRGGLISYYYNSPADTLDDCVRALDVLGATHMKEVIDRMNDLFPDGVPADTISRRDTIINTWSEDKDFNHLLEEIEESAESAAGMLENKLVEFIQKSGLGD